MKKSQIATIVIILVVMGYLYALPVKGLIKPKPENTTAAAATAAKAAVTVTVADVSAKAKQALETTPAKQISDLEAQLSNAPVGGKLALEKQLATKWDEVGQFAPAAFYYLDIARQSNQLADWLDAGKCFNSAYKVSQDTAAQAAFITNAVEAFDHATKLQPNNLEAKMGLGIAYVNGGAMPMQGIALLLEVVKQEPKNHDALLNLGMFSMKSGQYDKAVQRFKTMVAIKEEVEPYFYLAESYKQLGQKEEAIAAYEKCKELMGDPVAGQRIDEYIKELKK